MTNLDDSIFWSNYLTKINFLSSSKMQKIEVWDKEKDQICIEGDIFVGIKDYDYGILDIQQEDDKYYIFSFNFGENLTAETFLNIDESTIIYEEPLFIPDAIATYPDTILLSGEDIEFSVGVAYDPNTDTSYSIESNDSFIFSYEKINNISDDFSKADWEEAEKIEGLSYANLKSSLQDETEFVIVRIKVDIVENEKVINSNYYFLKDKDNKQIVF